MWPLITFAIYNLFLWSKILLQNTWYQLWEISTPYISSQNFLACNAKFAVKLSASIKLDRHTLIRIKRDCKSFLVKLASCITCWKKSAEYIWQIWKKWKKTEKCNWKENVSTLMYNFDQKMLLFSCSWTPTLYGQHTANRWCLMLCK